MSGTPWLVLTAGMTTSEVKRVCDDASAEVYITPGSGGLYTFADSPEHRHYTRDRRKWLKCLRERLALLH